MRHPFYKGVVLGALVAVVVMMATTALAGTSVGGVFNLGRVNTVNRTSYLSGTTAKKMLQVTNKGTGPALGLTVKAGRPPLAVNSTARVKRLNADRLDGLHASDLRKVYTARRDLPLSGERVQVLTLPGLVRIFAYNLLAGFDLEFHSLSEEGAYWARTGEGVLYVGTVGSQITDGMAADPGATRVQHYMFWDSQRAATVDVFVTRVGSYSDEPTLIVEATVS